MLRGILAAFAAVGRLVRLLRKGAAETVMLLAWVLGFGTAVLPARLLGRRFLGRDDPEAGSFYRSCPEDGAGPAVGPW